MNTHTPFGYGYCHLTMVCQPPRWANHGNKVPVYMICYAIWGCGVPATKVGKRGDMLQLPFSFGDMNRCGGTLFT